MPSLNKVQLMGHVGGDPECRHLPSGGAVANFSLATSEVWKDKNGDRQEETTWHKVVFFGKPAEIVDQYVRKGGLVYVEGRIKGEKYTNKDGAEVYVTKIIGQQLKLLGGKPDQAKPSKPSGGRDPKVEFDDDIPF